MKNIGNLFVRLFVVSLLAFSYFSTIVSLFGAGTAPFFYSSGSEQTIPAAPGSGSSQNVSAPAAPAPHPCYSGQEHLMFWVPNLHPNIH